MFQGRFEIDCSALPSVRYPYSDDDLGDVVGVSSCTWSHLNKDKERFTCCDEDAFFHKGRDDQGEVTGSFYGGRRPFIYPLENGIDGLKDRRILRSVPPS